VRGDKEEGGGTARVRDAERRVAAQ